MEPVLSEIALEETTCDNCGSDRSRMLFKGGDLLHALPGIFSVVQCLECGWMRVNPRPTPSALAQYYPEDYLPYYHAIEDEASAWRRWDRRYGMSKRCKSIERFVPGGRLLEVGCGTGIFLHEMGRRGWTVEGIEPSHYAAKYVRERFGLPVFEGFLEDYEGPPASFDVVAAWNVLEHLRYPAQGICTMQRLLKKDGLLVLGFPNYESLDRLLFGTGWIGWDLPRHLYVFPGASFRRFLERVGLQVLATGCPAGSYHAFLLSLQMRLRQGLRKEHWRHSDTIVELARKAPFRLLTLPLFRVVDALRLSSLLTYYLRNVGG
jgi:SAM-dependent methyltransferase